VTIADALRPTWRKLLISAALAYVLGGIVGPVLDWAYSCWGPDTSCAAYSAPAVTLARVLSWPILVIKGNFPLSIISVLSPEFILLWTYYYFLCVLAVYSTAFYD